MRLVALAAAVAALALAPVLASAALRAKEQAAPAPAQRGLVDSDSSSDSSGGHWPWPPAADDDDGPWPPHHGKKHGGNPWSHWKHPWGPMPQPPQHWRDVSYFNLIQMMPPLAADMLCELNPAGCPNLALFHSVKYNVHPTPGGNATAESADAIAVAISTIGVPTTLLSWFHESSAFAPPGDGWKRNPEAVAEQILKGHWDNAISVKGATYSAGLGFAEVIEYVDVDGNGAYNPRSGNDTVRSTYKLWDGSHKWGKMRGAKSVVDGNMTVFTLNVTTQDGVFGLAFQTSPSPYKGLRGVQLSPNATKVDVHIADYPLSAAGKADGKSRLALKTYVASASASARVRVKARTHGGSSGEADTEVAIGDDGFLTWVESVQTGPDLSGTAAVKAVVDVDATGADMPGFESGIGSVAINAKAVSKASAQAAVVYYSFDTDATTLYWDPSFGYSNPNPYNPGGNGQGLTPGEIAAVVIGSIGGIALIVAAGWYGRRVWAERSGSLAAGEHRPLVDDGK